MKIPRWLRQEPPSPRQEFEQLLDETKSYFIAQTLAPLKGMARTLAFGLLGAIFAGIGVVFCLIGVLRVLQTEVGNTFAGTWTFVPYVAVALSGILISAVVALLGFRRYRKQVRLS